jgi:hypothetical protein
MSAKKTKQRKKVASAASKGRAPARDSASYARALASASEKSSSVKSRVAELERLALGICDDDKVFRGVLALLGDTSEPPELRRAAVRALQAASFSVVAFNQRRTEYLAALRALAKDPDLEIRQSVLGILAREHDGFVQKLLLEGLENPNKALLPPEKALQLLSYDIHAEAYPLARKIVKNPPNAAAKREAMRLLGADPASASLFESVLRNKREAPEFRRLSASALQTLKPAALQTHAREIVLDDDEDEEVRATGLIALSQFGSAEGVGRDEELYEKTSKLKSAGSAAIKRSAKAFLQKYRRD